MDRSVREELQTPFVGGNRWGPRIFLMMSPVVICGAGWLSGEWQWLALLPFVVLAAIGLELAIWVNARMRAWIFAHGQDVEASVVRKRDMRNMNRVLAAYSFGGHSYESWASVTDKTFARIRSGDGIRIRVHPKLPARWISLGPGAQTPEV